MRIFIAQFFLQKLVGALICPDFYMHKNHTQYKIVLKVLITFQTQTKKKSSENLSKFICLNYVFINFAVLLRKTISLLFLLLLLLFNVNYYHYTVYNIPPFLFYFYWYIIFVLLWNIYFDTILFWSL